ncbi:hypothetical protein B0H13DRAFT_1850671 [Mycena leptocephala]|nr:hypothetical protein B0H13DRAFT_1850671 [Mycena leptocephala]
MYLMGIKYLKVFDREREWLAKLMSMCQNPVAKKIKLTQYYRGISVYIIIRLYLGELQTLKFMHKYFQEFSKCPFTHTLFPLLPSRTLICPETPPTGNCLGSSGAVDLQRDRYIEQLKSASNHWAREDAFFVFYKKEPRRKPAGFPFKMQIFRIQAFFGSGF